MGNKGFDRFTAGFAERFGTAEVRRVGFHEIWIESELADQEAELISESRLRLA